MVAKRVLDLTVTSVLLLLSAPLLAAIAVAVAATSPGGVLVRRPRAGLGGRPFPALRFRTTRGGPGGPRVTPVGRWLRRLSLDGLPQLVNVVRGEMSLVGPRALPVPAAGHAGTARGRLRVRPGITGLWQVSGDSDLPWEEMVHLDLQYVDEHWLGMDLGIMARTVPAVLAGRGAR